MTIKSTIAFLLVSFIPFQGLTQTAANAQNANANQVIEAPRTAAAQSDLIRSRINAITLAPQPANASVAREFIDISEQGNYVDVMIKELFLAVDLPSDILDKYIAHFSLTTGQWDDIDYLNNDRSGWQPSFHALRLHTLCRSYKNPLSPHYNSPKLKEIILSGIDYWGRAGLKCPNWWYNEIGVPKLLAPVYLLMRDEMSQAQIVGAVDILSRAGFRMTGQNKVALAGIVLMKALLTDDMATVRAARDTIVSEIYMGTGEGLQPDFSFHQHGPMMQFGNYGLAYISSMAYWGRVFQGTDLAMNDSQRDILSRYVLRALRWTVWHGEMDIASLGRQVFPNAARGKSHALSLAVENMILLDPKNSEAYKAFLYENQTNRMASNSLIGSRMFWRSDYLINRTKDWYASVRMSSNRTYGFEMTNAENLLGCYSADGVIQVQGKESSYDEIFPVWDWRQLPGLTVQNDGEALPTKYNFFSNESDFVGGVASEVGATAAMKLNRNGLTAHKAYFMLENMVICLGAGISATKELPTTTTIEQSLLVGDVTYGSNRASQTMQLSKNSKMQHASPHWVHQGSTGYLMIDNMELSFGSELSKGSWSRIAKFYQGSPNVQKWVFKMIIDHGNMPSFDKYAYAILPNHTRDQTYAASKNRPFRVLANSELCQAVEYDKGRKWQIVIYEPIDVTSKNFYFRASQAGIYCIERTKDGYTVALADPTQKLDKADFVVGRSHNSAREVSIDLPQGSAAGSMVMVLFE